MELSIISRRVLNLSTYILPTMYCISSTFLYSLASAQKLN